jgi:hypothetical protein
LIKLLRPGTSPNSFPKVGFGTGVATAKPMRPAIATAFLTMLEEIGVD